MNTAGKQINGEWLPQVLDLAAGAFRGFLRGCPADPPDPAGNFISFLLDSLDNPADKPQPGSGTALVQLRGMLQQGLARTDPCPALLAIGHIREALLALAGHARRGSVYTPHALAHRMAVDLLADWNPGSGDETDWSSLPRLLDPACGSGAFLLCCAQHLFERSCQDAAAAGHPISQAQTVALRQSILRQSLHGCDTDAAALQLCRRLLGYWVGGSFSGQPDCLTLRVGDTLAGVSPQVDIAFATDPPGIDWLQDPQLGLQDGGYDCIIGNPPYVDSEGMSRDRHGFRQHIRQHYRTARGNWDLFVPFIERSLELLRPAGRLCLVVPARSLCADYAAQLQALLLEQELDMIRLLDPQIFPNASIWTVVLKLRSAEPSPESRSVQLHRGLSEDGRRVEQSLFHRLPPGYMAGGFSPGAEYIAELLESSQALGNVLACSDGCTTAEAYRLTVLLHDDGNSAGLRLLNTGTIDPYHALWGQRDCRYLGQRFRHPVVDREDLKSMLPRRALQAQSPKLLVAGMGARIECLADTAGTMLCGKAAVQLIPQQADCDLHFLCGLLNSSLLNWLYRSLFGLRAYSSRAMNIGPRQLELLPLRDGTLSTEISGLAGRLSEAGHASTAELLDCKEYQRIDELVYELYGVDAGLRAIIAEDTGV